MSSPGLPFTAAPTIGVGASSARIGAAQPAQTNSALQLAGALQDLNPKLTQVGLAVAKEDQDVQAHAAKVKAIETGGKSLADAVREGKIEPTQNPYFIQDYNREAGAISAQTAIDQLNVDSTSWAEKNDPAAFRTKYLAGIAEIGKQYTNPDSQEGFAAAAQQSIQQQTEANVAYNVQRITQERGENLSALTAKQIVQVNAQHGGAATGAQVQAAIEPLRQQWLSTGGDQAAWNKITLQGILAASWNTHSQHILDASKSMSNGLSGAQSGSVYETLGSAEQIETARYRISGDQRDQIRLQIQQRQQDLWEKGQAAQGDVLQMVGPGAYTGALAGDQLQTVSNQLIAKYGAPAAAEAIKQMAQVSNSIRELNTNREAAYGSSSTGSSHIAALYQEANQRGWSPELGNDVGALLFQNNLSPTGAQQILDAAQKATAKLAGQTVNSGFPGKVQKQAASNIAQWSAARSAITTDLGTRFSQAVRAGHTLTPSQQQAGQDIAITAANDYLETHLTGTGGKTTPDFAGAHKVAIEAFKKWAEGL